MRRAAHHALLAAAFFCAATGASPALADEPPLETADGPTACKAFRAKNERELQAWEKEQPAVPYHYPREDDVANAPWGRFFDAVGQSAGLLLATILPSVGAQLRADTPAAVVSWPWQFPIAPPSTCSRKKGTFKVDVHRPHRIVLEPGIVSSNRGIGVFARPGYRYVYHPSDWVVGVGGGLGNTIEIAGQREPFRVGIGPEALLHFGHCCEPSYFTLAARYDHFFNGNVRDTLTVTLGYSFF